MLRVLPGVPALRAFPMPPLLYFRIVCLTLVLLTCAKAQSADLTGEQIYLEQCVRCHGILGVGTAEVGAPLTGDQSLKELSKRIHETMPEDTAEKCSAPDAELVAAYIHQTFYSIVAQERNRPARVELSHLTVRQYENMAADLISSFHGEPELSDARGIKADYYKTSQQNKETLAIERTDPQIDFQFGEGSPGEPISPGEYSVQWSGALSPPETGVYEFIVETENVARLFLNEDENPLVDASVRSGDEREYRGTARLLARRPIHIRLEFFKSKEKTASIRLKWKPPLRPVEVIPDRCLSPLWVPRTLILTTQFPPDDRSRGYERGSSVSREWYEATTQAALEIATAVVADRTRRPTHQRAAQEGTRAARLPFAATPRSPVRSTAMSTARRHQRRA